MPPRFQFLDYSNLGVSGEGVAGLTIVPSQLASDMKVIQVGLCLSQEPFQSREFSRAGSPRGSQEGSRQEKACYAAVGFKMQSLREEELEGPLEAEAHSASTRNRRGP